VSLLQQVFADKVVQTLNDFVSQNWIYLGKDKLFSKQNLSNFLFFTNSRCYQLPLI